LLACGIHCVIQLYLLPLLLHSSKSKQQKLEYGVVASLTQQGILGLAFFCVGLFGNYYKGYRGAWLTSAGAVFMVLVSIGFMVLVYCPSAEQSSEGEGRRHERSSCRWKHRCQCCRKTRIDSYNQSLTDPLLPPHEHDESTNEIELQTNEHPSNEEHESTHEIQLSTNNESSSRIRGTKRLIKLAHPQMPYLYLGCIILLIRLPFSLAIPHFISTTLGFLSRSNFTSAKHEILLLFIIGTIDAVLDFWCIFLFGYAKERVVRKVRIDLFGKILEMEVGFFDRCNSGDLSSRLVSDCDSMSSDLTWFFRFSIESAVRIIGVATYMLIRSPQLGGCALAIVPIVGYINKKYGDWLQHNAKAVQDALADANAISQETLNCVRTVIAFATEKEELKKYEEKIEVHYQLNIRQLYMTGAYYMLVSTFLINTCVQASLLLLGTSLIQKGKLTPEILLAFMLYQGQLQNETLNLFQSYTSLIKSSGAGDKVFALLDRVPPPPATGSIEILATQERDNDDNNNNDNGVCGEQGGTNDLDETHNNNNNDGHLETTAVRQNNINLCSLSFTYPSRPLHRVLDKLDLHISGGSTVALVGPSGCGKSTIIGLLERFYDPDGGAILIDGVDLRTIDIKTHRRSIGIVTQDPILFSGTIRDNIAYGFSSSSSSDVRMEDITNAAKLANAHDFISLFPDGYDTEVGERGVQLSGGQKQRVAIARAIIKNPGLLLLDEATSALDPESERVVQEALDHLLSLNTEMTTIIVAHRLGTVRKADCIAVVHEGCIIEKGSHLELMEIDDGFYRNMVERADAKGILPEH